MQACAFRFLPKLQWIEFWDGLETIGSEQVLNGCSNVSSIYIPSSVTTIETRYPYTLLGHSYGYFSFLLGAPNLKIYCGSSSAQPNWSSYWNARGENGANRITNIEWGKSHSYYRNNR